MKEQSFGEFVEKAIKPNYKKVHCVKDEEGHWYVLPYELKDKFDKDLNDLIYSEYDYIKIISFESNYSQYMTGGDLNLKELYIKL